MLNPPLANVLYVYFAFVFEHGVFPQIFKIAKVILIFKSGPRNSVNNYRPISILPSLSKVLEKLIKTRLANFFHEHDIFYDHQFGFREKHNVLHALLDVSSYCFDQIQNKKFSALMLMDLRKAFDTVSHKILLKNFIITVFVVLLINYYAVISQIVNNSSLQILTTPPLDLSTLESPNALF